MNFKKFVKYAIPIDIIILAISFVSIFFFMIMRVGKMGSTIGMGFGIFLIMIFISISIFSMVALWIWMIIDVIIRDIDNTEKIIWILLMFFIGIIISIIYFYIKGSKPLKKINKQKKINKKEKS